ncbi:MAG: hypothetical protein K9K86_09530 [Pseudomonadales bacterium]|nr:hypothetical protein [Pseudomonadales bacterium]
MRIQNRVINITRQRGSALFVSLIILLIMTILGVQGLSTTILEEKMSGNYRDNHIAFEAAEAALREGERWLNTKATPPIADTTGTNKVWTEGSFDVFAGNWAANGINVATNIGALSANPQYIIEQLFIPIGAEIGANTPLPQKYFYRITSRAVGGTNDSEVVLQTTFVRQY